MCEWSGPRAPSVRRMFDDVRATPAVLAFLRDTSVEKMVTLAPPEEEGGEGGVRTFSPQSCPLPRQPTSQPANRVHIY